MTLQNPHFHYARARRGHGTRLRCPSEEGFAGRLLKQFALPLPQNRFPVQELLV